MSIKEKDLARLRAAELIDEEQYKDIRQHLFSTNRSLMYRRASVLLYVFGVVMLVSGIIWLVIAFSVGIPRMLTVLIAILLAAVWGLWYRHRESNPSAAQAAALFGVALWIAAVHWEARAYGASIFGDDTLLRSFTCCIGFLFIPFFSRQVIMVGLSAASTLYLWGEMTYETNSVLALDLGVSSMLRPGGFLLLALFWALLGERWRDAQGMYRRYGWIRFPAYVFFFIGLRFLPESDVSPAGACAFVCLGAPILYALIRPRDQKFLPWLLLGTATGLFMFTGCLRLFGLSHFAGDTAWFAVGSLYVAVLLSCGVKYRRISWVNYGFFVLLLMVQLVVQELFDTLEVSGVVLLALGIALLPLALSLERVHRSLVKRASGQTSQSV